MSDTSNMSSAQLMREILTYQQTTQKLRAEVLALTKERDDGFAARDKIADDWWRESQAARASEQRLRERGIVLERLCKAINEWTGFFHLDNGICEGPDFDEANAALDAYRSLTGDPPGQDGEK